MPRAVTGEPSPSAGLLRAVVLGALVFVVMALLAAVVTFAGFFTGDADVVNLAKVSGVVFFLFHNVGMKTEFPTFELGSLPGFEGGQGLPLGPIDLSFTISVALLLGTLLALVLLYRAGRRAAEEGGGTVAMQILQGAAVALPYAALSALLSLAVRFEFELGPEVARFIGPGGLVEVSAPLLQALLWPLAIAAVAGGFGGYAAARRALATPTPGRLGAMVSGAWRMLVAVLVAGFVGLLVLGALSPDLTASYFEAVAGGREGLQLLLATILAVPNMALWGVTMGMGGSIVAGDFFGAEAQHVASLLEFPTSLDPSIAGGALVGAPGLFDLPTAVAPIEYFAFIPLTLIALIVGGRMAAQRARVLSAGEGAVVGAGAGVIFGIAFFAALALAGIAASGSVSQSGFGLDQAVRVGPGLLLGALLGVAWGAIAGAIGGATGAGAEVPAPPARRPTGPPPAPPSAETTMELPADPAPAPFGSATGFEGLAARRPAPRSEPEAPPEPEREETVMLPPEPEVPPEPPSSTQEPDQPQERAEEGPPAFEFTTPRAQWRAPPPELPTDESPEGERAEESEPWRAPEPEPQEETPDQPEQGWMAPQAPDRSSPGKEPAGTPPWSDPAAFEPRPWTEEPVGDEETPVAEPWMTPEEPESEDEDEDDEEEGPSPA